MSDPNKTVFISYRRDVSKYLALMVFKDLQQNGYDVFLDVEKIDSGSWESVILNQIAARTHFVLLLTPGTFNRCIEPTDVLRREIEHAMSLGRNIVPLFADKFELKAAQEFLTGNLVNLPKFNGMNFYDDMIEESLIKLRERFLKAPVYNPTLTSTPAKELTQVNQIIIESGKQPDPTHEELSAEQFFSRAYANARKGDLHSAIADYTHAIQLKANYIVAYYNRGKAYRKKGQFDAAIADYTQAIELRPDYAAAFNNRGVSQRHIGRPDLAIGDYTKAIEIKPDYFLAHCNRGEAYFIVGQLDSALNDFKKVNEILSADHSSLAGLAITYHAMGNKKEAYRIWATLIKINYRYKDVEWVKQELNWAEPLVEEARKLIAEL